MCGWAKLPVCGNSPVFSMCVWVESFSATDWFLSHISELERQSYYTKKSGVHGAAASMVRHEEPGYSLQRHVPKPGLWFGTDPCGERISLDASAITPGFLWWIFKTSIFRTLNGYKKLIFMRLKKVMRDVSMHKDKSTVGFKKHGALTKSQLV